MLFLDRQLDEFRRPGYVDKLIAVQILAFDAEQNIAIVGGHRDHHRRRLAGAESVFVDDDFDASRTIAKFGRRIGCYEDGCFSFDRRQKTIAPGTTLTAFPGYSIIAIAFGNEIQLS